MKLLVKKENYYYGIIIIVSNDRSLQKDPKILFKLVDILCAS